MNLVTQHGSRLVPTRDLVTQHESRQVFFEREDIQSKKDTDRTIESWLYQWTKSISMKSPVDEVDIAVSVGDVDDVTCVEVAVPIHRLVKVQQLFSSVRQCLVLA